MLTRRYISRILWCTAIMCFSVNAAMISGKQISVDEYELVLENDKSIGIDQSQQILYETAIKVCAGKKPQYGKYKFTSREPIDPTDKKMNETDFRFTQIIKCVDAVANVPSKNVMPLTGEQEEKIKVSVTQNTTKYLGARDARQYKVAYGMMTKDMQSVSSFDVWEKRQVEHFGKTGKLINRHIKRVTIYNNPPNSPRPGIYVAADYESEYTEVPVQCGYVLWFQSLEGQTEFRVMREEYGHLDNAAIKRIPPEELGSVKKKIGCKT